MYAQVTTVENAKVILEQIIDNVTRFHDPVLLTGISSNAVVVSEEDWRSLQETLHLQSIPGYWQGLEAARREPLDQAVTKLEW